MGGPLRAEDHSPSSPRPFSWRLMVSGAPQPPRWLTPLAGPHTPSAGDAFLPSWWPGSLSGPRQQPGLLGLLETELEVGEGSERGGQEAGSSQPFNPATHSAQVPQQCGLTFQASLTHRGALEGPGAASSPPSHDATCPGWV